MKTLIVTKNTVEIDMKQMPGYLQRGFFEDTADAVKRFFDLPGTQERYEAWLKTYKGRRTEDDRRDCLHL